MVRRWFELCERILSSSWLVDDAISSVGQNGHWTEGRSTHF
jgi:hypothetical protein